MSTVYLVVPCYNEEAVLPETVSRLTEKMKTLIAAGHADENSRFLLVDDGSKDKTWELICRFCEENPLCAGLKLAHNRGHQNALLAGLMAAKEKADCAISLDADLQDDIDALDGFLAKFEEGCDVVYGVRNKRDTDSFFKRSTARGFYKVMKMLGVDVVYDHADYRLMSRRALEALGDYKEVNLFLRGIVPLRVLRPARAFRGGIQIPAEKDDFLCPGWHHLVQCQTSQAHLQPRDPNLDLECPRPALRPDFLFRGGYGGRMDRHRLFHLASWGHSALVHRGFRRLYRQNLQRGQGPAPFPG